MLNKVLQLLENNRNIFITGPAGVGKTFLTESIIKHFKQKNEKILVCAPTGIAALNIKGITISSAFIIGFHSDPDYIHTLKDDAN
ncbi:hypothetical protein FACS189459_3000 [Bacilli bacterium]|nr:hypothetical protein FACS189459_3000 [Bacilli bacterium]GHU51694.1 hypothetical protein FACS189496_0430 [Bacilli bacterium]